MSSKHNDGAPGPGRYALSPRLSALAIALAALAWMVSGSFFKTPPAAPVASSAQPESPPEKPRVRVNTIESEDHVRTLVVLGRTEAENAVFVRAQLRGRVVSVAVKKGALVDLGDVLAKLDAENIPARLNEAQARLQQRKMAYQAAQKLSQGGFSSRLKLATTKADLAAATAVVAGLQRDLKNTTITAPFAGIVDALPIRTGDFIDKIGTEVARLIDLTTVLAVGEVVEQEVGSIDVGGAASVRLSDGRVLRGQVSYVAKSSNALTRTFRVEVLIRVPDGSVPQGLTTELRLPLERAMAHKISPALLTLNADGAVGVKIVNDNDVVEFYPVEMVSDTTRGIWLTGLPRRARVITVGQEFVSAGQSVVAVEGALETEVPPRDKDE